MTSWDFSIKIVAIASDCWQYGAGFMAYATFGTLHRGAKQGMRPAGCVRPAQSRGNP